MADEEAALLDVPDDALQGEAVDDADILSGLPMGDEDVEAAEEAAAEAAAEASEAAAARQKMVPTETTEEGATDSPVMSNAKGRFVGKRKIIEHTLSPGLIVGVDANSEEERAKREARASKFGVAVDEEERAKREARGAKFGVPTTDPELPPAAEPMAEDPPLVIVDADEAQRWASNPRPS